MRPSTPAEGALLASRHYVVRRRVAVRDAAGTWRDLDGGDAELGPRSWVRSLTWGASVEQPVEQGTLALVRSRQRPDTGQRVRLAPLARVVPIVDDGARLRAWTAIVPPETARGAEPADAWRQVVEAVITSVDAGGLAHGSSPNTLTCQFADVGALIARAQIKEARPYGSESGTPLADVIAAILSDWVNPAQAGVPTPLLVVAEDPDWMVRRYSQSEGSALEAIRALAAQIGWEVRYQWTGAAGAAGTFALVLGPPVRDLAPVPHLVHTSGRILAVPRLETSYENVRTEGALSYVDAASGQRQTVTAEAGPAALGKYGRVFFRLAEDAAGNIDTAAEAQRMLDAAIADLSAPPVSHDAETRYDWRAVLGDTHRFAVPTPNDPLADLYEQPQTLGVVGYTHSLSSAGARTTYQLAGRPSGAKGDWQRRSADALPPGARQDGPGAPVVTVRPVVRTAAAEQVVIEATPAAVGGVGPLTWRRQLVTFDVTGPWSAPAPIPSGGVTAPETVTRHPRYQTLYLAEVVDEGTGNATRFPYIIEGQLGALDALGRVRRDVAFSDNAYALAAADAAGLAAKNGVRVGQTGAFLTNLLEAYVADLSMLNDGGGYARTTTAQRNAAGRADLALDLANRVRTGVAATADIAGLPAAQAARAAGGFVDDFSAGLAGWTVYQGNASVLGAASSPVPGATGGNVIRCVGQTWIRANTRIPLDGSKLYRIRVRAAVGYYGGPGTDATPAYFGVEGLAPDGVTRVSRLGTDQFDAQHYLVKASNFLFTNFTWATFTGYLKAGVGIQDEASDPRSPSGLHPNARYFTPTLAVNFAGSPAAEVFIDAVSVEVLDEDASARVYTNISVSGDWRGTVAGRVGTAIANAISAAGQAIALGDGSVNRSAVVVSNVILANMLAVGELSAISANLGVCYAGVVRNASGTRYLDLDGVLPAFFKHEALTLGHDGSADYSGPVSASLFRAPRGNFAEAITLARGPTQGIEWEDRAGIVGLGSAVVASVRARRDLRALPTGSADLVLDAPDPGSVVLGGRVRGPLPTTNPGAGSGLWWNDNGTVKVA